MNNFFLPFLVSMVLGTICGCFSYVYVLVRWRPGPIRFSMCFFIASLISFPILMMVVSGVGLLFGVHWQIQRWLQWAVFLVSVMYPVVVGASLIVLVCLGTRALGAGAFVTADGVVSAQLKSKRWQIPGDTNLLIKILRRREWAFLLESLLLLIGPMLMIYWMGSQARTNREAVQLFSFSIIFFNFVYVLIRDCFGGISPGKLLLGIRVVDFTTGEAIGPVKSFLRNWIYLFPLAGLVELAVASSRPDKRRLGDLIAGTVVVFNEQSSNNGTDLKQEKPEKEVTPNPFG